MNATREWLSLASLGLSLVVGCGETTSDVDTTGRADAPRGGMARDAGDGLPRTDDDGARGEDASADGGQSGRAGRSTSDDDAQASDDDSISDDDSDATPSDDDSDATPSDDDSEGTAADDDAEGTAADDDSKVAPSTPTNGSPPPSNPGAVGEATWDPEDCHVPTIEAGSDPVAEMQWTLAREYCATIEQGGCLDDVLQGWHTLDACSDEERLNACVHLLLEVHNASVVAACDDAWSEAITCATQSFGNECLGASYDFPYGPPGVCPDENDALLACVMEHSTEGDVEGTYTSCAYGPGATSECEVVCQVGENYAALDCSGPDGVPMRCDCSVNGIPLNEGSIPVGTPDPIWVNDCEDAARQAADGLCTSRLDCCFEYSDGQNDLCMCGAIPERAGFDSCEALADSVMGHTVDICPRYEKPPNTCWPPPCDRVE